MTDRKQYDPNWPFPQYDENGKIIMPPPEPRTSEAQRRWNQVADLEEALL